MDEQMQTLITQAAADAIKAYQDKFAAEPAINPAGVAVAKPAEVKDNRPAFKSMGEFLHAVARQATHGERQERLLALKSDDPLVENGFNVAKALGADYVGTLSHQAMKAPTGLGEQIPSGGAFLVGTDRDAGVLSRVYNLGQVLQRIRVTPRCVME